MVLRRRPMSTHPPPLPAEPSPAFDREAAHYRRNWDSRPLVQIWRGRVLSAVLEGEGERLRVLDVGSGSGADSAVLRAAGCESLALEPSAGMRAVALERGVVALAGGLEQAAELASPDHDVVLLNFGVLNCVARIEELGATLARVLRVGGRVVLVWMSRHCPVESFARLARGQRPRRGRSTAIVAGQEIPVSWWSVGEVEAALGSAFRVRRVEALGLLVPAPDLGGCPGWRSEWDPWLSRWPILREWGDHTLLVAERLS